MNWLISGSPFESDRLGMGIRPPACPGPSSLGSSMTQVYWSLGERSYPSLCFWTLNFQLGINTRLWNLPLLGPSPAQPLGEPPPPKAEPAERLKGWLCFSPTFTPTGRLWPAHEDVAALAGCSDHPAEEAGGWGSAAVGQQAGQAAAGQGWDCRGEPLQGHSGSWVSPGSTPLSCLEPLSRQEN